MSNEKNRFIYCKINGSIHEKHCDIVRQLCDQQICFLSEYDNAACQCTRCAFEAFASTGAEDPENHEKYKEWFEQVHADRKLIRKLYIEYQAVSMITGNILHLKVKDDRWKICIVDRQGHVRLFHNNYKLIHRIQASAMLCIQSCSMILGHDMKKRLRCLQYWLNPMIPVYHPNLLLFINPE